MVCEFVFVGFDSCFVLFWLVVVHLLDDFPQFVERGENSFGEFVRFPPICCAVVMRCGESLLYLVSEGIAGTRYWRDLTMAWTEEKVSELKELWGSGLTTSQIGERLGYSKNAVIGKAHRLGLARAVPGNTGGSAGAGVALSPPSRRGGDSHGSNARAAGEEWVSLRAQEAEQSLRNARGGASGAKAKAGAGAAGGAGGTSGKGGQEVAAFRPRVSGGASGGASSASVAKKSGAEQVPVVRTGGRPCQWPMGTPKTPDFHFCGSPATEDSPYCPEHRSRAYVRKTA